jgi:hypothetical protein
MVKEKIMHPDFVEQVEPFRCQTNYHLPAMRNFIRDNLVYTPPEGCSLKVGDYVEWRNINNQRWINQIIGFNYKTPQGVLYQKYVFLDTEAFWFAFHHEELTKLPDNWEKENTTCI